MRNVYLTEAELKTAVAALKQKGGESAKLAAELEERNEQTTCDLEAYASEIVWARDTYCSDELEIDDTPLLSPANDGVWVSAWVWVPVSEPE